MLGVSRLAEVAGCWCVERVGRGGIIGVDMVVVICSSMVSSDFVGGFAESWIHS